MATIGNTATPSFSYNFYATGSSNVLALQITMPTAGQITSLSAYFSGKSGSITARLCIWDTSGNLLAQTADMAVGAGSGAIGGQAWQTASLSTPYNATGGEVLRIGWWRHSNQSDEWTENSGGTEYQATDSSNTTPPASETFSSVSGSPSIYATYTASTLYADDGSAFQIATVYADDGSVWQATATVWADNGTAWVQIA